MKKLIVNYAPTGMIPIKSMTPHVPITVNEIIEDVHEAYEIGITIAHIHARNPETEEGTFHAEIYAEMIEGIRKYAPDLILCTSLSGRNFPEFEKRSEPLNLEGNLKPDMGSLTLSSLNFTRQASMNSPKMVIELAAKMKEKDILPELEAFDLGMVNYMHYLIAKDLIKPPYYINLLFNNIAGAQADLTHIGIMIRDLPENTIWSLAGLGRSQLKMNTFAILTGGGVRVGLEDNIFFDQTTKRLAKNIELVQRIHDLAEIYEREIMPPAELRKDLQLKEGFGNYGLKS